MKKLVLAALAALCLFPAVAHSQNLLGVYAYPGQFVPRDSVMSSSQGIYAINDTCAIGSADSTCVFNFSTYDAIGLQFVTDSLATTSTNPVRIAAQIRIHPIDRAGRNSYAGADSSALMSSWFPSEEYSLMSTAAGDSVAYGTFRSGSAVVQHDGEIVFMVRKAGSSSGAFSSPTGVYQWFPLRATYVSVRVRILSGTANTSRLKLIVYGLRRN